MLREEAEQECSSTPGLRQGTRRRRRLPRRPRLRLRAPRPRPERRLRLCRATVPGPWPPVQVLTDFSDKGGPVGDRGRPGVHGHGHIGGVGRRNEGERGRVDGAHGRQPERIWHLRRLGPREAFVAPDLGQPPAPRHTLEPFWRVCYINLICGKFMEAATRAPSHSRALLASMLC